MISAVEEIDSVVKCIEMGAADYLNKPFNPILLKARVDASLEKKRLRDEQRALFRRFATDEVADELLNSGFSLGGRLVEATVLFSDIRSFTTIAESQSPEDTIELLNAYFSLMIDAIANEGGIVNQIIGDGLMSIFGAPLPLEDHRQRAVRAARQMMELIESFNQEQAALNRVQIKIGIGIASGEVVAGYVGTQRRATYTCVADPWRSTRQLSSPSTPQGRSGTLTDGTRASRDPPRKCREIFSTTSRHGTTPFVYSTWAHAPADPISTARTSSTSKILPMNCRQGSPFGSAKK